MKQTKRLLLNPSIIAGILLAITSINVFAEENDMGSGGDASDSSSPGSGTSISANASGTGRVITGTDTYDMYVISASSADVVKVRLTAASTDTLQLDVYNSAGTLLDYGTSSSSTPVEKYVSGSGSYYIRVKALTTSGGNFYSLSLSTASLQSMSQSWVSAIVPSVSFLSPGQSTSVSAPDYNDIINDPSTVYVTTSMGPGLTHSTITPTETVWTWADLDNDGILDFAGFTSGSYNQSADFTYGDSSDGSTFSLETVKDQLTGSVKIKLFGNSLTVTTYSVSKSGNYINYNLSFDLGNTTFAVTGSETGVGGASWNWSEDYDLLEITPATPVVVYGIPLVLKGLLTLSASAGESISTTSANANFQATVSGSVTVGVGIASNNQIDISAGVTGSADLANYSVGWHYDDAVRTSGPTGTVGVGFLKEKIELYGKIKMGSALDVKYVIYKKELAGFAGGSWPLFQDAVPDQPPQ